MEKNELATTTGTDPMKLIELAIAQPDLDTEKLGKLMDLQERWEGNQARKAFAAAMADFQSRCPMIKKDRKGHNSNYAGFDDIMRQIRPLLSETGFAVRFSTVQDEGTLHVTCSVSHREGYFETSNLSIPVDKDMRANDSQKVGSANSYAKRYSLMNALNIVVSDEDDDGHLAGSDTISEEQAMQIQVLLDKVGFDEEKEIFLKWAKAETVEDILAKDFEKCVRGLEKKLKGGAK